MSEGQFSVESVEQRLDVVEEMAKESLKFFERQFTGTPPGYVDPDPATFRAWFEEKLAQSPPVPMVTPDGREIVASPWATALAYAEGGKEIVNRYLRIAEQDGE